MKAIGKTGLQLTEPLSFQKSSPGRKGYSLTPSDVPIKTLDKRHQRTTKLGLPELSEIDVVRHFTRLSTWNYNIDLGIYPLGSCTMKYNPKINEDMAKISGFSGAHPYQPESLSQGALQIMFELQNLLCEISGFDFVTLQPAAGAQGEFVGLKMIRAYHTKSGNPRKTVLIPDTAHGTNPASCTLSGYDVIKIPSNQEGIIEPSTIAPYINDQTAAFMMTNPNTLGLFEKNIHDIANLLHEKGALLYCDGANMNALMGIVKLGKIGADVLQFNLHKTFSTPHGGGGPGSGPVAINKKLESYLPLPTVEKNSDGIYFFNFNRPHSIGKVKAFWGNFSMLVRAYTYILSLGSEGLKEVSKMAILNANYIKSRLLKSYHLAYEQPCMHECIFTDKFQNEYGIKTLDIAKRLIDYGFHPPTVYFPLVVHGAMMIEPTETESKEEIDRFCDAMIAIALEAKENPEVLKNAPVNTIVRRVDEVKAAKELILTFPG